MNSRSNIINRKLSHLASGEVAEVLISVLGGLGVIFVVLLSSALTAWGSRRAPAASFDTQLRAAQHTIQQYADDQVWLYSVTEQEGSFDAQLNEALNKIRNN
jgi:hypothetical protein